MALTIEISRIFPTHQDIDLMVIVDGGKKITVEELIAVDLHMHRENSELSNTCTGILCKCNSATVEINYHKQKILLRYVDLALESRSMLSVCLRVGFKFNMDDTADGRTMRMQCNAMQCNRRNS